MFRLTLVFLLLIFPLGLKHHLQMLILLLEIHIEILFGVDVHFQLNGLQFLLECCIPLLQFKLPLLQFSDSLQGIRVLDFHEVELVLVVVDFGL